MGHRKALSFPARGMWKGMRENEEVFQSQRAVFVPPYTTGLGLGNPVSQRRWLTACEGAGLRGARWIFFTLLSLKIMNVLTCLQRPDCLVSRFYASWVSVSILSSTHGGFLGTLYNQEAVTMGRGQGQGKMGSLHLPWASHCFPSKDRRQGQLRGVLWPSSFVPGPLITGNIFQVLFPPLSHSHSSLPSLEEIPHIRPDFHLTPSSALWG